MPLTDVLIRDVSDQDLARIDKRAAGLGLSRGEYLRRQITADAARGEERVTVDDLKRVSKLNRDLLNEGIMRDAWS